jgi:hypothetical protein
MPHTNVLSPKSLSGAVDQTTQARRLRQPGTSLETETEREYNKREENEQPPIVSESNCVSITITVAAQTTARVLGARTTV